jgi:two-component system cell cycle response regulator
MTHTSTILVVDDEAGARDTLEALLFREGYNLAFTSSGPEALKRAAELTPDVILLDVMMPGMDGFEVCWRLRADPLLAQVPILLITALDDRDSRLRGIEAGADDFVSKPFDRGELRARVRTITQLNRYRHLLQEQAKFEWVVEQADDGYLILSENDQVLYANPQARLYFGLPSLDSTPIPASGTESTMRTFLELARQQYTCEPQEAWTAWPALSDGTADLSRYLVRPKSSSAAEFWLHIDVLEMASRPGGAYLVRARDVTTDVVNRLNVWTFQGLVNHKLRTPLTMTVGYLDILAGDLEEHLDAETLAFFVKAHESLSDLQDRVLDILKYMDAPDRVEADMGSCSPLEIPVLISEINTDLKIEFLSVINDLAEQPDDIRVPISRRAMELILWELLQNAIKFHPQGSPAVEVELCGIPNGVRLEVRDDGLTLSPEQLLKMWTPYYQAERGFSGQVPGMGLGLSMVATLVWRVGGTCTARNRGGGSGIVVELNLPVEEQDGRS